MIHILYLAHDVDDAAIWRRVAMLEAGGATVSVAGFERGKVVLQRPAHVLGRTADGQMAQRALAVLRGWFVLRGSLDAIAPPDIILARNLEMLVLAQCARRLWPRAALVYEILDIHRMMLGVRVRARALRWIERAFLRSADLVITSSTAFVRNYFAHYRQTQAPIRLVENKCLAVRGIPVVAEDWRPGQLLPLVIGWFGILRCRHSLDCLDAVTRAAPGHYRVVMRGRPALDVMPDFHRTVSENPDLEFAGAYRNPDDLADIYRSVHLSWLVDRFDPGQNSDWLLPNRLYEGCCHGAVPIALTGTETAGFLSERGLGLTLAALEPGAVTDLLGALTGRQIDALLERVRAEPSSTWTASREDCVELVNALAAAAASNSSPAAIRLEGRPAP